MNIFISSATPDPFDERRYEIRRILRHLHLYCTQRRPKEPDEFTRFRCTMREIDHVSTAFSVGSTDIQPSNLRSLRLQLAGAQAWFDRCTSGSAKVRYLVICDLAVMRLSLIHVGLVSTQASFTAPEVQTLFEVVNDFCDSELSARQRLESMNEPTTIIARLSKPFHELWKTLRAILDDETPPDPSSPSTLLEHLHELNAAMADLLAAVDTVLQREGLRDALVETLDLMVEKAEQESLTFPTRTVDDARLFLISGDVGAGKSFAVASALFAKRMQAKERMQKALRELIDLASDSTIAVDTAKAASHTPLCVIAHIDHGKTTLADAILKHCREVGDRERVRLEHEAIERFAEAVLSCSQSYARILEEASSSIGRAPVSKTDGCWGGKSLLTGQWTQAVQTQYRSSSIGRVPVSKTGSWGFKALLACQDNRVTKREADRDSLHEAWHYAHVNCPCVIGGKFPALTKSDDWGDVSLLQANDKKSMEQFERQEVHGPVRFPDSQAAIGQRSARREDNARTLRITPGLIFIGKRGQNAEMTVAIEEGAWSSLPSSHGLVQVHDGRSCCEEDSTNGFNSAMGETIHIPAKTPLKFRMAKAAKGEVLNIGR